MAIEGDIQGAYDNVDFEIFLNLLKQKITDISFIKFIKKSLHCGLIFKDPYKDTLLGVPQGSIVSPLFFNIYMHEFDKLILNQLSKEIYPIKIKPRFYCTGNKGTYYTSEYQKLSTKVEVLQRKFYKKGPNLKLKRTLQTPTENINYFRSETYRNDILK